MKNKYSKHNIKTSKQYTMTTVQHHDITTTTHTHAPLSVASIHDNHGAEWLRPDLWTTRAEHRHQHLHLALEVAQEKRVGNALDHLVHLWVDEWVVGEGVRG